MLARAHGRHDIAALLRRDPDAIADRGPQPPSLDEFAASLPSDYYSEAELIELHRAQFGDVDSRGPARRRQRLRERLVLAVQWAAGLGARDPQPGDAVAAWLDDRLAGQLAGVGIIRLEDLLLWIRHKGFHWQRRIAKVGPQRAAHILQWLVAHETTLGALPLRATRPPRLLPMARSSPAPRCALVPIDRFSAPAAIDGSNGGNRAPLARCKLTATNDLQAVQAWLRLRVPESHTWRAYRREAERFLLWAVLARGKPLSSLEGDDCVAYRDFLANPAAQWTGPRHVPRWSEAWRPFEGPLSARSQAVAVTILRSLCEWLVRRHYLDSNPWDDVPQRPDPPSMPRLRALSQKQWALVQNWLAEQAPCPALHRLRFVLNFAYFSGMRLSELANARLGWLRHEPLDDGELVWSIMVLGKRQRWREVPLPDLAVSALRDYLDQRGLAGPLSDMDPETPLIASLVQEAALTPSRIYELLVAAFGHCADDLADSDRQAADRIRQASTHWLRHTHVAHAVARGVPADVLQANLGHQSLATTSIYVQAEKGRRHRAVQAAFAPHDAAAPAKP